MLAQQNVETLNEVGATKIVVTCAHCFNTIKNEYPQLGGKYEVRAPHPAAQPAGPREAARPRSPVRPSVAGKSPTKDAASTGADGHLPRPLLPRPAQRRLRPAARAASAPCPASSYARWSAARRSRSAAAPAAPACGWRRSSARGSTPTAPRRPSRTGAERIAVGCPFCRSCSPTASPPSSPRARPRRRRGRRRRPDAPRRRPPRRRRRRAEPRRRRPSPSPTRSPRRVG